MLQTAVAHDSAALWRCWLTGCMAVVLLAAHDSQTRQRAQQGFTSRFSLADTIKRLEAQAEQSGLAVFARLAAPLQQWHGRSASLLVLGISPDATPVIQTSPRAPIDLPLLLWVEEQPQGGSKVLLPDPAALDRPGTPQDLRRSVALLPALVSTALA